MLTCATKKALDCTKGGCISPFVGTVLIELSRARPARDQRTDHVERIAAAEKSACRKRGVQKTRNHAALEGRIRSVAACSPGLVRRRASGELRRTFFNAGIDPNSGPGRDHFGSMLRDLINETPSDLDLPPCCCVGSSRTGCTIEWHIMLVINPPAPD